MNTVINVILYFTYTEQIIVISVATIVFIFSFRRNTIKIRLNVINLVNVTI
jgi:hypothetical protein